MAVHKKFPALGRGLDALIPTDNLETKGSSSISEIPLDQIYPNPEQPRREMTEDTLAELADSIRSIGIIQPITLRQKKDGGYEIIAGERRWHAAKMAGLTAIPAYIRKVTDEDVMEMALIENIQREDLNPIEIALAYSNLIEKARLTQEQVADRVGKKRATVANYLRLLKLPAQIQLALRQGTIDQGHARAIAGLSDPSLQVKLFKEVQEKNYSVHKIEDLVKELNSGSSVRSGRKVISNKKKLSEEHAALQQQLSVFFSAKVQMNCSPSGKGRISIPFNSEDDLERIVGLLGQMKK